MSAVLPTTTAAHDTGTPHPLDQPLPSELTGRTQGWLSRYRRYPVFSAPWVRGRLRVVGISVTLLVAATAAPLFSGPSEGWPLGGFAQLAVQIFVPLLAGPWLALQIRRRGWSPDREWRALVGLMAVLVATMLVFHGWVAEPMKQRIAEANGQVGADGKRKRLVMQIGVTIADPEAPRDLAAESPVTVRLVNATSSALLTFFLAGGCGLWGWRRERAGLVALAREQALARAMAERREAELRLSVLAAQVEPHFLFNTLAGVRSAIRTDPSRASEMVDRLVEYLRAAIPRLRSDGGADATLGRQLEIVEAYLALMAARMPRLQWSVDAAAELRALPFPPLMLISLAENAVKHGVEPKIGAAHVRVQARRADDGRLAVTVADDGAGFGASSSGDGLGLVNIRERLQQMYGERAALALRARPDGGVAATITLPTA